MVSLLDLIEMYPENKTLDFYKKETEETWTRGKYYLGGQVRLAKNEIITQAHINEVERKYESIPCCNSFEQASMIAHIGRWEECKKLLANHLG